MNLWQRFFGQKVSEARIVSTFQQVGKAQPTPANYEGFSKEGYQKNVVAFSCINRISISAGAVPWYVRRKDMTGRVKGDTTHPVLDLLNRPNPSQGGGEFLQSVFAFYALTGNTYIEANGKNGKLPAELWSIRPDKVNVIPGTFGMPQSFRYKDGSFEKVFDVNPITGESLLLQVKTFNPTNYWYGMSPLESALMQVDQNNMSAKWNLSLLQNSATPSGILKVTASPMNPTGTLKDDQITRLRQMIDQKFSGSKNAGRPMVLEHGLEWQSISWSPKDMEFLESKNTTARDIALAFGVPPLLLNINGDNTFKNYAEARVAFYEDTIIPMLRLFRDSFNKYFANALGGLELDFDIDQIDAMAPKRAEKFNSYKDANFLTVNEKRQAIGYEPIENGDVLLIGSQIVDFSQEVINDVPPNDPPQTETPPVKEKASQDGFKAINLLGKGEKRESARQQNRRMERLESDMSSELNSELNNITDKIAEKVGSVDRSLINYTIMHIVEGEADELAKVLRKFAEKSIRDFAGIVLRDGKSFISDNIELKSLDTDEHKSRSRTRTDQAIEAFLKNHVTKGLKNILGTTTKKAQKIVADEIDRGINDGLSAVEVANNMKSRMRGLNSSRADLIARTEIGIAAMQGSLEAAKSLQIPGMTKEWVSTHDDRTRDNPDVADHSSADGQIVGLNEKFHVEPDAEMDCPKDPSADASQICNCRCVLVYKVN